MAPFLRTSWVLALPMNDIHIAAIGKRVEPALIMAIVSVESGGDPCATRYEPHYHYLFKPETFAKLNRITENTEIIQQKTSWGLMQVMGGVARERKFIGPLGKYQLLVTNLTRIQFDSIRHCGFF